MYTFLWTWKNNNKQRPLFGLRALFSKVTNDSGALYNKLCFYYFSCCYCQWRHWKSDWKTPGAFYFSWPKLKRARKTNEKRLNTWWKTHKKRLFSHFPTLIYRVHAIFKKKPDLCLNRIFLKEICQWKTISELYILYRKWKKMDFFVKIQSYDFLSAKCLWIIYCGLWSNTVLLIENIKVRAVILEFLRHLYDSEI